MLSRTSRALALLALASLAIPAYSQTAAPAATCVKGASGLAPTATITFVAPTTNTDGTPVATPLSYVLLQSTAPGAETQVAGTLTGSPISVTTGLLPSTTYYFKVQVKDANGNISALSNESCKAFPSSVPGTVTITIS